MPGWAGAAAGVEGWERWVMQALEADADYKNRARGGESFAGFHVKVCKCRGKMADTVPVSERCNVCF